MTEEEQTEEDLFQVFSYIINDQDELDHLGALLSDLGILGHLAVLSRFNQEAFRSYFDRIMVALAQRRAVELYEHTRANIALTPNPLINFEASVLRIEEVLKDLEKPK